MRRLWPRRWAVGFGLYAGKLYARGFKVGAFKAIVGAAVLWAATACTWTVEPRVTAHLDAPVNVRPGWTAAWQDADLTLQLQTVLSDDRCPRQVVCEWAGEARLQLRVQAGEYPSRRFELSTYPYFGEDQLLYAGYAIRLVEVSPYPKQPNEARTLEDYRITLVAAPATAEPLTVSLGTAFQLQTGQSARLDGDDLTLTWERLLDDSRCPTMVTCAWIGEARLALTWVYQGAAGDGVLTTLPDADAGVVVVGPYRVRLLGVTPAPEFPDQPLEPSEYAARWNIEPR